MIFKTRFSVSFHSPNFQELIQRINAEGNSGADQDFQQNFDNNYSQKQPKCLDFFLRSAKVWGGTGWT